MGCGPWGHKESCSSEQLRTARPGASLGLSGEESAASAGEVGLIPGSGRSPGGGDGNPLQYSCLENPTDRGAWWAMAHEVVKSWR